MENKYSLQKGVWKGFKSFLIFFVSALIVQAMTGWPEVMNYTIGGVLTFALNFLKMKTKQEWL